MFNNKECKKCIWFDQCHESEVCEDYTPALTEEEEDNVKAELYMEDLDERHELYREQLLEQNDEN